MHFIERTFTNSFSYVAKARTMVIKTHNTPLFGVRDNAFSAHKRDECADESRATMAVGSAVITAQ